MIYLKNDKRLPKLERLIEDAHYILDSVDEDNQVNKEAIMSVMRLVKLDIAEARTLEADNLMLELNYEEVNLEALSGVRSYIDLIDHLLVHNNHMYNRVMKLALEYLE